MLPVQNTDSIATFTKTRAFANIALIKYWGKQEGSDNSPATPSLSLAIDSLETITEICLAESDSMILNGRSMDLSEPGNQIMKILLDWRQSGLLSGPVMIETVNNFPSKAGLASSASGIAALTVGLNRLSSRPLSEIDLIKAARRGSGSSARSITGGLSIMTDDPDPVSEQILSPDQVPWGVVTAITDLAAKKIGSREAMEMSRMTSPYYSSWLTSAKKDFDEILKVIYKLDLTAIGEITERNCLAMHACMMTSRPSLMYWNAATIDIIDHVRLWRSNGLEGYFTIDAGPQVFILCRRGDCDEFARRLSNINGIKDVLIGYPAGGAGVLE